MARHSRLLREDRDLAQVLDHDAQHHVVADLGDAREFALTNVARAGAEHVEERPRLLIGLFRAGSDDRQLAGLDHFRVAAHRRREIVDALRAQHLAKLGGAFQRDRRALDHHLRLLAAGEQLLHHRFHVIPGRHHAEHDVARGQLGQRVDHFRTVLRERFRLGARAVPDGDVAAALRQARGHLEAHAAGADPAKLASRGWQSVAPLQDRAR